MGLKELQSQVQTLVHDIEILKTNQNTTIPQPYEEPTNAITRNGTNTNNTMLWNASDCTMLQNSTRPQKPNLKEYV